MALEWAASEFAGKERLTASEFERAKDLMVQVKRLGMSTPKQDSGVDRGRWRESTAKGYTKGVRPTDPEPWKSTAALFSEMLSRNLSLADVS